MASRLGCGPTMYKSSKTAKTRHFQTLVALCLTLLCTACSVSTITLSGEYPAPLARKLPITVGVYYPEELRNYAYVEIDDNSGKDQYIIRSGESQINLFNTVLPALFQDVVLL